MRIAARRFARTVTLPLIAEREEQIVADAQAKRVSSEARIQELIDKAVPPASEKRRIRSAKGILAHLAPELSAEEIDENRSEMFRNLAQDADER